MFQFFGSITDRRRDREETEDWGVEWDPTKEFQPFLLPELTTTDYFHFLLKLKVTADKISKYSDALMRGSSSQKQ